MACCWLFEVPLSVEQIQRANLTQIKHLHWDCVAGNASQNSKLNERELQGPGMYLKRAASSDIKETYTFCSKQELWQIKWCVSCSTGMQRNRRAVWEERDCNEVTAHKQRFYISAGQQESNLPILFLFINSIVIGTLMWLTVSVIDWAILVLEREDLQKRVKCLKNTSTQCLKYPLSSMVLVGLTSGNWNNPFVLDFFYFWKSMQAQ